MCRRDEFIRDQRDLERDLAAAREELRQVACLLRGFNCELGGAPLPEDMPARQLCDHLAETINMVAIERRKADRRWNDVTAAVHDLATRLGSILHGGRDPLELLDDMRRRVDRMLVEFEDRGRLLSGRATASVLPDHLEQLRAAIAGQADHTPLVLALALRLERLRAACGDVLSAGVALTSKPIDFARAEAGLTTEEQITIDLLRAITKLQPSAPAEGGPRA